MEKNDIPDIQYEYVGYYWMSDRKKPEVIGDKENHPVEKLPEELRKCLSNPKSNPFVVEAQLYSPTQKLSIGIRYVDGQYIISRYEEPKDPTKMPPSDSVTMKHYIANRMEGRRLLFRQYWEETPDPLCEGPKGSATGMKVLQPAAMAFEGFEKITETTISNE